MNISLTPELARLVKRKVKSGTYNSASEVVREALRLLQVRDRTREDRIANLRKEIQVGIDELERGEGIIHDEKSLGEFFESVKSRGRQRLKAARKRK